MRNYKSKGSVTRSAHTEHAQLQIKLLSPVISSHGACGVSNHIAQSHDQRSQHMRSYSSHDSVGARPGNAAQLGQDPVEETDVVRGDPDTGPGQVDGPEPVVHIHTTLQKQYSEYTFIQYIEKVQIEWLSPVQCTVQPVYSWSISD